MSGARATLALAAMLFALAPGAARAEPFPVGDACFLRAEPRPPGATPTLVPAAATPGLVSLHVTAAAIEATTTEASCQAQALCAGQVQLHGGRFDLASRVPAGTSPCFGAPP